MNMPRGARTQRKLTAYHEAGHALSALHEGRLVGAVFLSPTHPEIGACMSGRGEKNPYDVLRNQGSAKAAWLNTVEAARSDIRIALAGPLAEAKFLGKPLRALGSKSDLDSCIYQVERLTRLRYFMAEYFEVNPFDPDQILEAEKRRVRSWLARPAIWSAVSLVALGLFQKGSIGGAGLTNVIGVVSALRLGQMPLCFR